jgi:hypothetical protein
MKMRSEESLRLAIDQKTCRDDDTGCMVWTGSISAKGRMSITVSSKPGDAAQVPRVTWAMKHGKIPEGHIVARRPTCSNERCVEPAHFELMEGDRGYRAATAAHVRASALPPVEEALETIRPRKTHCKRDHEYTPENTAITRRQNGAYGRACRACRKQYQDDRKAAKTAAAQPKAA